MRTCMVLLDWPRPEPWQVSHGWSTTRPRPLHSVHGSVMANTPPWTEVCMPVPSHFRQTFGTVPYFAPVPRQVLHGSSLVIRSATVTPLTASANSIVASVSMSAPRRGRAVDVVVVVRPPPPNMPPRMSPSPPPPVPPRLNKSPTLKSKPPPPDPLPPGIRKAPLPNSRRASSYSLRFLTSPITSYASEISLNLASAVASPELESGWYLRASLR